MGTSVSPCPGVAATDGTVPCNAQTTSRHRSAPVAADLRGDPDPLLSLPSASADSGDASASTLAPAASTSTPAPAASAPPPPGVPPRLDPADSSPRRGRPLPGNTPPPPDLSLRHGDGNAPAPPLRPPPPGVGGLPAASPPALRRPTGPVPAPSSAAAGAVTTIPEATSSCNASCPVTTGGIGASASLLNSDFNVGDSPGDLGSPHHPPPPPLKSLPVAVVGAPPPPPPARPPPPPQAAAGDLTRVDGGVEVAEPGSDRDVAAQVECESKV